MQSYSHEQSDRDVAELLTILRVWNQTNDSDSVEFQGLRAIEFNVGVRFAEKLVQDLQPERRLRLKIGGSAVRGFYFSKGAYDMQHTRNIELEPGYDLPLERTGTLIHLHGPSISNEHYLAGRYAVNLTTVAETLGDGGSLGIEQLKATAEAKDHVDKILSGSWTQQGVSKWWHRKRYQLIDKDDRYRTPAEVWEENPQLIIDLAIEGRSQTGT